MTTDQEAFFPGRKIVHQLYFLYLIGDKLSFTEGRQKKPPLSFISCQKNRGKNRATFFSRPDCDQHRVSGPKVTLFPPLLLLAV